MYIYRFFLLIICSCWLKNPSQAQNLCQWRPHPQGQISTAQPFLSYTPEPALAFFSQQPYLSAQASLLRSPKGYFLHLQIIINDPEAGQELGLIDKDSELLLENFKESQISLRAAKTAVAIVSETQTLYEISYPLSRTQLSKLRRWELNKIQLNWEKLSQYFDIYEVDSLRKLADCVE